VAEGRLVGSTCAAQFIQCSSSVTPSVRGGHRKAVGLYALSIVLCVAAPSLRQCEECMVSSGSVCIVCEPW
jgi:hypothetical protein